MGTDNTAEPLRVMLVDDDHDRAARVESSLVNAGVEVMTIVSETSALLYQIEQQRPDVVLIDLNTPGRDILESLALVNRHNPVAMVMFAQEDDPDYIQQAIEAGISTYLVEGINPEKVKPLIDVALAQFRSFQSVRRELQDTKQALEDQQVINRAKALLIRQKELGEEAAHSMLRRMAMQHNLRLVDVARTVIGTLDNDAQ